MKKKEKDGKWRCYKSALIGQSPNRNAFKSRKGAGSPRGGISFSLAFVHKWAHLAGGQKYDLLFLLKWHIGLKLQRPWY